MTRFLITLCAVFMAISPASAQTYTDPITGGPLTWDKNEVIGDGSTPNGGTPPAIAQMGALPVENYDASKWTYQTTDGFRAVTTPQDQAKVRFTCIAILADTIDSLKLPGKPKGSSHWHTEFGKSVWTPNETYAIKRAFASNPLAAKNGCPGFGINNSIYWGNSIFARLRVGGPKLIKKPDLITLYYYLLLGGWEAYQTYQPLFPGWGEIMGTYMEDPDQTVFRARVAEYAAQHPELGIVVPKGGDGPAFKCETTNGSNPDSINPGSAEQPALTNPDKGFRPTLTCPAGETVIRVFLSHTCWDGQLPKPGDAYSHLVPLIHMNSDGKAHCPNHYWRKPVIETQERYSHKGDLGSWDCDEVDAMALANASAKAGKQLPKRGACWASHEDYDFGWDVSFARRWQCRGLGISLLGATNCYPHDLTANQIDDTTALVQPASALTNKLKGTVLSDFFVPPPTPGGMHGMMGHGPMAH